MKKGAGAVVKCIIVIISMLNTNKFYVIILFFYCRGYILFCLQLHIHLPKLLGVNVGTSVSVLLRNLNDQTARKELYRIFC